MFNYNTPRRRILRRAIIGLAAVVVGSALTAVQSPEFREFVGDSALGSILLVGVPAAILAADKWLRERKAE